ncbi:MAG: hypothetical protein A2402_03075 [Candidatus Staskawiczbacteria bacterium RIFOXYC1_FULL_37_43]|nr:MAG: hypothetical protein A2813_03150 [Candidatus Staskawiczbacteria bacterium RIFCSPHIGHO2_01_FULL_37_17]OGZ71576.1 MAG: hypothetical protein A2891_02665 [Candidatus Staskawiczbacteria bacterium RIFCSPLOWO2_01_FULL_37_19]OGZ76330.1 MAG: hypothetical protein A2205_01025 [Candidatus Staskawiczbacteria bacterium RIFOXYA1_FULL_37_15]OGZ76732.1 MAG: hypothetical protein A2280_02885 [Candidatus Staskawiczbacteria bacterium RIFOXYA12_FULL_37_10]OGZ80346.1 MAG: hypothetical protein A2353_03735 [Can
MKKKIKKIIFYFLFAGIFLAGANFAYALEAKYPSIFGFSLGSDPTLPEYAKYFFNIGIAIAGALAVIVIAWGGIQYMFTFGLGKMIDPKKGKRGPDEAKAWIKAGILGLLLIVCSYLIAYTINPYLVIFDLSKFPPLTFLANFFNPPGPQPPVQLYSEIPIGKLTENLLSRQIDCYDFDGDGNPILGEQIKTDDGRVFMGPTYLKNDRVDCILKLTHAADRKAEIVKKLSDEIVKLMQQCVCSDTGKCSATCKENDGKCSPGKCAGPGPDCCPSGIKEIIEHGPIPLKSVKTDLTIENIPQKNEPLPQYYIQTEKKYLGLDEFRSQFSQNYQLIKNAVEVQPPAKLNGQQITIINPGNCELCIYNCHACYAIQKDYANCIAEQQKCEQQKANCEQNRQDCLKKTSPWHNLRLIDQLIYLQGRIEEIKETVKKDSDKLKETENYLGQCYLADSYIDFIKTFEKTDKDEKIILVDKPFSDPITQEKINPAKYCQGFEFNNSSCYSQCKDICPGASKVDFNCYSKAKTIEEVKSCYDYRSCVPGSKFTSFYNCMSVCKEQCAESCQEYLNEDEKKKCVKNCANDSQCLIDNESTCLVDFAQLQKCANSQECRSNCAGSTCEQNTNDCIKSCIENSAYKCAYCSDQYAGYPDCLKSPYSLQGNYSASFIKQYNAYQICSSAYAPITITNSDGTKTFTTCLNLYPETAKCPASSKCPECPCDLVEEKINYPPSTPPKKQPSTSCAASSDAGATDIGSSKTISQYRICSGTCDDLSYNDDPLTFYCQQDWWLKDETKNTTPIGHDRICPKEKEIPVGQTIDDSEKWADDLIKKVDEVTKKIKNMIQYMQRIGQEKNYCKCDSKCENGDPVCKATCDQSTSTTTDSSGNSTTTVSCSFNSCQGNACQTMIDFLLGAMCKDACKKGEGVPYFRNQVNIAEKDFLIFTIEQNRSDIVKELEYSRQQTNTCSAVQNNYGAQTRLLSCTRVQDEIISPQVDKYSKTIIGNKTFSSYCYGKSLGKILQNSEPLADNWFCCEDRKKEE